MKFKFLKHTADIKFQTFGSSLEEIFENSAIVLRKVLVGNKRVRERIKKKMKISGEDYESLLYNFLEEFLFLFDSEKFILSEIKKLEIKEEKGKYFLICYFSGDNAENYSINEHIKAVTYNSMFVKKRRNKWVAQVIIDV